MAAFDSFSGARMRKIHLMFFLCPSLMVLLGSFVGSLANENVSSSVLAALLAPMENHTFSSVLRESLRELFWMVPVFFAGFFRFSCCVVSLTAFFHGFLTGYYFTALWRVLSVSDNWRAFSALAVPFVTSFPVFLLAGALACSYQHGSSGYCASGRDDFPFSRYIVLMLLLSMLFFFFEIGGRALSL